MSMKLWLLRPVKGSPFWGTWYDKAFGFVVRAETEEEARKLAQEDGGREVEGKFDPNTGDAEVLPAWTSPAHSTCVELLASGPCRVIIKDFYAA